MWLAPVLMCVLAAAPAQTVEADGIAIDVDVRSQIYTWTVRNVDAPPITRVEIPDHHTYNHKGPPGWTLDVDGASFGAEADRALHAIRRGQARAFTCRVSSYGAILGTADVNVLLDDGTVRTVPGVWAPVPRPRHIIVTIMATMISIGLFHALVVTRRGRASRPASG